MSEVGFLLVTCCLDQSRTDVLNLVVDNLRSQAPELIPDICVFDNASTYPTVKNTLCDNFDHVYVANQNVGYWTAIDWWLTTYLSHKPPKFTYIIESDMIHYDFDRFWIASRFLRDNPDVGSVRLHEYSIENRHLYNKDVPVPGSKTQIWQSHTNKITGKQIVIDNANFGGIHTTNFLTQLPALNRYKTMCRVFDELRSLDRFSELDFQRLYHNEFATTAILDGGIFHCNPGAFGSKVITGSWSSPQELSKLGYLGTRQGTILKPEQYTVSRVG